MGKVCFDYNASKGDLLLDGVSVAVLNKGALAKVQRDLEKIIGPTARNLIYRTLKQHTLDSKFSLATAVLKSVKVFSRKKVAETLISKNSERGMGRVEIVDFDKASGDVIIRAHNTLGSKIYRKGELNRVVCYADAGIYAGILSSGLGVDYNCTESKCVVNGDDYCEFVAKLSK